MARIILNYLIPLFLPIILYLVWIFILRRRSRQNETEVPSVKSAGIFTSVVSGIFLMLTSLILIAIFGGSPPGTGVYQSPKYEDGKIIPPKFE